MTAAFAATSLQIRAHRLLVQPSLIALFSLPDVQPKLLTGFAKGQ
jgi:hypothetical protein